MKSPRTRSSQDQVSVTNKLSSKNAVALQWSEWNDFEINTEKWDPVKLPDSKQVIYEKTSIKNQQTSGDDLESRLQPVPLPPSLQPFVAEWKRPNEIWDHDTTVTIYNDQTQFPDLITRNKHLFHSEIMNHIICAMLNLQYLGLKNPLTIEWDTPLYVPSTAGKRWHPCHHIYSMCKAGKGQNHTPQVNKSGMYILRLYYFGCWRKVVVGDTFPVDKSGNLLLPMTYTTTSVELWPLLLTSGLLKIAALTWTNEKEVNDFDGLTCLSGWFSYKINTKNMSLEEIWKLCTTNLDNFKWPPEVDTVSLVSEKKSGKHSPKSKEKQVITEEKFPPRPTVIFGVCDNLREKSVDEVPLLTPCWNHTFLMELSRDIPELRPTNIEVLAKWKRIRWLPWAVEHGLCPPEVIEPPIKCLKIVSFLRTIADDKFSEPEVREVIRQRPSSKSISKKNESESKGAGDSFESHMNVWVDLNKLYPYISEFLIYFKPSFLESRLQLSDLSFEFVSEQKTKKDKPSKEASKEDFISWPTEARKSRKEPIFIFIDNIKAGFLLLTVTHNAHQPTMPLSYSHELSQLSAVNKDESSLQINNENECLPSHSKAIVVVDTFNWMTPTVGNPEFFFSTIGIKSYLYKLERKRVILQVWINSQSSYTLNILSDVPHVVVGGSDVIFEAMKCESKKAAEMWTEICVCFEKLNHAFGKVEYQSMLQAIYKSIIPDLNTNKNILQTCRNKFVQELSNLVILQKEIDQLTPINLKLGLQVLLLDFDAKIPNTVMTIQTEQKNIELISSQTTVTNKLLVISEENMLEYNLAAIKIQSFFKGFHVRKLMKYRISGTNTHKNLVDTNKKIYEKYFSPTSRPKFMSLFMRNFIKNPKLCSFYSMCKDFDNVVDIDEFTGQSNICVNGWVLLVRKQFYCTMESDILLRVMLYCDLPSYLVRVYNNDTQQEMKRLTNNTIPCLYSKNKNGYTIIAYGFSESTIINKDVLWKLKIIRPKISVAEPVITYVNQNVSLEELSGNYFPNYRDMICKFIVKTSQYNILTLHLQMSYENVEFLFRIKDEKDTVIKEVKSKYTAILPLTILRNDLQDIDLNSCVFSKSSFDFDKHRSKSAKSERSSRSLKYLETLSRSSKARKSGYDDVLSSPRSVLSIKSRKKLSKTNSINTEMKIDSMYGRDAIYYVEAIVLNDTWPLTATEWATVERQESKKLLKSINKPQETSPVSKKPAEKGKGTGKKPSAPAGEELQEPFWRLHAVYNGHVSSVSVAYDSRRDDDIKLMKMSWEAGDPGRASRAAIIRQDFLEQNQYITSQSDVFKYVKLFSLSTSEHSEQVRKRSVSITEGKPFHNPIVSKRRISSTRRSESGSLVPTERSKSVIIEPTEREFTQNSVENVANEVLTDEVRTLKPMQIKIQNPLQLSAFEFHDDNYEYMKSMVLNQLGNIIVTGETWIKNTSDEICLQAYRHDKMKLFEYYYKNFRQDMEKEVTTYGNKMKLLETLVEEKRSHYKESTEFCYQDRVSAIEEYLTKLINSKKESQQRLKSVSSKK